MEFVTSIKDAYPKIIVSKSLSEPQIYLAFYNNWPPSNYQSYAETWRRFEDEGLLFVDQLGEYDLCKYKIKSINFNEDKKLGNTLIVGKPNEFPPDTPMLKTVNYPNGEPAILIYDTELERFALNK